MHMYIVSPVEGVILKQVCRASRRNGNEIGNRWTGAPSSSHLYFNCRAARTRPRRSTEKRDGTRARTRAARRKYRPLRRARPPPESTTGRAATRTGYTVQKYTRIAHAPSGKSKSPKHAIYRICDPSSALSVHSWNIKKHITARTLFFFIISLYAYIWTTWSLEPSGQICLYFEMQSICSFGSSHEDRQQSPFIPFAHIGRRLQDRRKKKKYRFYFMLSIIVNYHYEYVASVKSIPKNCTKI